MRNPVSAAAVTGIALIVLGAVVYAVFSSLDLEDYAMTCTSGLGCVSRDPLLFTLHGAALDHVQPLFTAGAVSASAALALAAVRPLLPIPTNARRVAMRPTVALWCVAVVLIVGGAAYATWSRTPDVTNSTIQECTPGVGCSQTVVYTLQQLSYVVVPAALTAGFLALALAIVVTAMRRRRPVLEPDGADEADDESDGVGSTTRERARAAVWGGRDLTPFMPPSDRSAERRR
ncbi:hypothetical protein ACFJGV_11825 [Cnuibacter sp. UC19_7]|uniref:hypothetical protein n=1 Tax=Cnuibacter sp. UC19_7 TaxID=3350166 RepID=UPI00366CC057